MGVKKDLSIEFLGVKCENPFFLSSSPVGSNYEMCAKALRAGWGGIYYKTIGILQTNVLLVLTMYQKRANRGWALKIWSRFLTSLRL